MDNGLGAHHLLTFMRDASNEERLLHYVIVSCTTSVRICKAIHFIALIYMNCGYSECLSNRVPLLSPGILGLPTLHKLTQT
jgi:hypothetical protein